MRDARLNKQPGWRDAGRAPPVSLDKDERYTPEKLEAWVHQELELPPFDLDVAACRRAHLAPRYYTRVTDGLAQPWCGDSVWCNPPYSAPAPWLDKAWAEAAAHRFRWLAMLLPAMRQEQPWWQRCVEPWRDRPVARHGYLLTSHHPPGRWSFRSPAGPMGPAGFPLVVLVWRPA